MFVGSSPLAPLAFDVVRELAQRRSLNLRDCGFESRLRHSIVKWVDWTWESELSVKQSLIDEQCRFNSYSATEYGSVRCWYLQSAPQADVRRFDSGPSHLTHDVVELVDTRRSERRATKA